MRFRVESVRDMPDTDHDFDSLEGQEAALLSDLRAMPKPEGSSEFASRVMDEIAMAATLKGAMPAEPVSDSFSKDVMARLGETPARKVSRFPSYLSHLGVAVASLLFALVLLPIFESEESPSQESEPSADTPQSTQPLPEPAFASAPSPAFQAKVRDLTSFQGQPAVILGAGLVEGLRVADSLELQVGKELVPLRIQALSSWVSIATYPLGTKGIEREQLAVTSSPTPRMLESMKHIKEGTTPTGVYFGLGIVVEEVHGGLFIRELIPRIWHESRQEDLPSRAAELGLLRGDRIESALGLPVTSDQSFVAALSQQRLREGRLRLTITREGKRRELRESKSTRR